MIKMLPIIILLIVSCSTTPPNKRELASLNYGSPPENSEALYKYMIGSRLKDPDSAIYDYITKPRKGWIVRTGDKYKHGWFICGKYNAKNSFGAYTGYQYMNIRYLNGETFLEPPAILKWERYSDICGGGGYNEKDE